MTEFEKIYRTYFNAVYIYILKLSKNKSLAEDITSETFFKAMSSLKTFRGECDIRVWLCQIAKNCYYTYLRKQRHFVDLEDLESISPLDCSDPVIELMEEQSNVNQIHKLLNELPAPYKEVFALRVLEELSFKQIGHVFSKTDNWACVTYHRARNKIIQKMEEEHNEK